MKKVEVKQLVIKIVSVVIDALFRSCSPKNKQESDLDSSRHLEQQGNPGAS